MAPSKQKFVQTSGTRKKAVARAVIKEGSGIIRINGKNINTVQSNMLRLKMLEPIIIYGKALNYDIDITTQGGGITGQADAVRLVIAKALVGITKDNNLKKEYSDYDKSLLVADVRVKETRKPNRHGKARARKQTSYR